MEASKERSNLSLRDSYLLKAATWKVKIEELGGQEQRRRSQQITSLRRATSLWFCTQPGDTSSAIHRRIFLLFN